MKSVLQRPKGMTLLELLLVLGMIVGLLSMIWSLMQLYSSHYLVSERKVSRAQLVRSISQMINDDLAAAVQDPIHSLPTTNSSGNQFIRHFGLRGDSRSLQIDVVQLNLFTKTATVEENRQAASGLGDSPNPQVPELKTIFYEFIPINAREKSEEEGDFLSQTESDEVDLGSAFTGSLQSRSFSENEWNSNDLNDWTNRPLVRKYGLSRYELDFETVDDSSSAVSASQQTNNNSVNDSQFSGSFNVNDRNSSIDDWNTPDDLNDQMLEGLNSDSRQINIEPYLTASQLALDSDDGTVWIPEIIDCRFRYFDGNSWFDYWNSIEKNGLPIAIEVSLKLLPLDDVEILRTSPQLLMIPEFKNYESATTPAINEVDLGSRFAGSLQSPNENNDHFSFDQQNFENLESTFDPFADNLSNGSINNLSSFNDLTPNASLSLDAIISDLGLTPPLTEQVISYLPTTPLAQHQVLERRKPVVVDQGYVQSRRTSGSSGRRNAQTGERQYRERVLNERSLNERTVQDRQVAQRTANERSESSRQSISRTTTDRLINERNSSQRTTRERTASNRTVRERLLAVVSDQTTNNPSTDSVADSNFSDNISNPVPENNNVVALPGLTESTEMILENDLARGFTPTDSTNGVAGLVPQSEGTTVLPTQTSKPAQTQNSSNRTTQSWIRGKSK